MKSENVRKIPTKEVFLSGFYGDRETAVGGANLGTIRVWLCDHPTWVLDSPVTLYVALRGVLRGSEAMILSRFAAVSFKQLKRHLCRLQSKRL